MDKNDGGPAFPAICDTEGRVITVAGKSGMSLRDYFAAAALPSLFKPHDDVDNPAFRAGIAYEAYQLAEAMLAERDRDDDKDR